MRAAALWQRGRAIIAGGVLLILLGAVAPAARSATDITVTSASDDADGDASSVAALHANPGPDGTVSLREAIQATNNDPGIHAVHFDASLKGSTILVAAQPLPPLTGGGVSIDGDVDGDGQPDVTLANGSDFASFGLDVVSSGNTLHALAVQGFPSAVVFTASPFGQGALPTGQTFAGNVVSGFVITGSTYGGIRIWPLGPDPGHPECLPTACQAGNQWTDTQIVDNTIGPLAIRGGAGISVRLKWAAGDTVQRLTVARNLIHVAQLDGGIDLTAGDGGAADGNRIADAVVAHNTIEGGASGVGLNVGSGVRGGSANVVEGITVADNHFEFSGSPPAGDVDPDISLAISDGGCPSCTPPAAARDNVERNIRIVGNVFEGSVAAVASDPCCGGPMNSRLSGLTIARNKLTGSISRQDLNPWGIQIGAGGAAVSKVVVSRNSIMQRAPGPSSRYRADLAGGGIAVLGGLGNSQGSVRDVVISRNRIDTPLLGITIVGGGPRDIPQAYDTIGDHVFGVTLRGNTIVRAPRLATRWNRKVKGITVIGGLGGLPPNSGNWRRSVRNSVRCIRLKNNVVMRRRDAVSVFANLGPHASRNTARLGGC